MIQKIITARKKKHLSTGNLLLGFVVIISYLSTTVSVAAQNMVCFLPQKTELNNEKSKYLTLKEPFTSIEFDSGRNIKSFVSSGCNNFINISYWDNNIAVKCKSNAGGVVILKIDLVNYTFEKIYSKENSEEAILRGHCRLKKD